MTDAGITAKVKHAPEHLLNKGRVRFSSVHHIAKGIFHDLTHFIARQGINEQYVSRVFVFTQFSAQPLDHLVLLQFSVFPVRYDRHGDLTPARIFAPDDRGFEDVRVVH